MSAASTVLEPETFERAAELLREHSARRQPVRIAGASTKPWAPAPEDAVELRTCALNRILAHEPGDMTASLEAGVSLREAQARFAAEDQMLALDPPSTGPSGGEATIGGIVATADSGPLAHRFGGPRDLVVGMTVALSDGTIARSGGTVIKNVAGYDVAKLFCGGFGTLGLILSVNVRLHPRLPAASATGASGDPATLCAAARTIAALPAELDALDLAWSEGEGRLLARCAGSRAAERAARLAEAMTRAGLTDATAVEQDEAPWERQRAAQRSTTAAVLHVAGRPSDLPALIAGVERVGGSLVARAALGDAHLTVDPEHVGALRGGLPARAVAVLRDCPAEARAAIGDPWGTPGAGPLALMRALKARFDPGGICNPGTFVGGI